jgi:uncharacterized repeat protein (TIGR01451 family)
MKNEVFNNFGVTRAALALFACLVLMPVFAQQTGQVESKLEARKVVLKDGKESFESGAAAKPGDTIEYVATYTNKGKTPVGKLEPTLPIPANTEFIAASQKPGDAKASTGGTQYDVIPLKRKIKQPDGKEIEQTVPLREYRSLRWFQNELAAGATATFVARVKVVDDRPADVGKPAAAPAKK